tara:strand:- start:630 stop:791 length:162 start_codon:yes stop_codon:yes gene_type:complete
MRNNKKNQNKFKHLYNPKEEGLGTYDIHYINAYRKNENLKAFKKAGTIKRCAA